MITKNIDEINAVHSTTKAGFEAEKTMSHYLKRAFEDDPDVIVLNGLRLQTEDDTAQIDHLIIHKYGMIIVESKSANGMVRYNDHGEWVREYGRTVKGIPSPIKQAERQAQFLKKYLDKHAPKLPKNLFIQLSYLKMPVDILVAFSDTAVLDRSTQLEFPCVLKADYVPDKVKEIMKGHADETGFLSLLDGAFSLNEESRKNVDEFLRDAHTRSHHAKNNVIHHPPVSPHTKAKKTSDSKYQCKNCNSSNLSISYGRYGYYFKCNDCAKNTPIKQTCKQCHKKAKVRKEKDRFFIECRSCGASILFHTNPK